MLDVRKYNLLDAFRIPFKCAPMATAVKALLEIGSGITPTLEIIAAASFIDIVILLFHQAGEGSSVLPSLFAIIGLIGYNYLRGTFTHLAETSLTIGIRKKFLTSVLEKIARLPYRYIENHNTLDLINRIMDKPEEGIIRSSYFNLLSIISLFIRIIGILGLLFFQVWWTVLLILATAIPLFYLAVLGGRASYAANREVSKYDRMVKYLGEVLKGRDSSSERALFGYGEYIAGKWYEQYEIARKKRMKIQFKWFMRMKSGGIFSSITAIIAASVLISPVISGSISVGMYIAIVSAIFSLAHTMSWQLTDNIDQLAKHAEYTKDLTEFVSLEEKEEAILPPIDKELVFDSLEFRNVSFRYPGTENYIIEGLSLKLEKGKHYALVGINGAGKTTITKLLVGLYDNYEGEILLNRKELKQYPYSEILAFFSIVYQDFCKYNISLKDNIALGDVNNMEQHGRIINCARQVGLNNVLERLPRGILTPLGKVHEDGIDVSGGEWQRIAMARALMNPAPFRILDEPTASLDPVSESKMYQQYKEISREKTTLFISHRLGSTKLADKIFVISNGKVVESGDHYELMENQYLYRKMFDQQRVWYE